jgi:hypothetical protein
MRFFGNSLTADAKNTEAAIKEMHAAEEKLTEAKATGDAEAIKIAEEELKDATYDVRYYEAYEVTGHMNPGYDPLDETIKHTKYDIETARSGGYPLNSLYIEKLKPAYDKRQLSTGLSELVKDAIAKQSTGGRRYKSKKYKRTSKKHKRTSKKHKRTSKRHK